MLHRSVALTSEGSGYSGRGGAVLEAGKSSATRLKTNSDQDDVELSDDDLSGSDSDCSDEGHVNIHSLDPSLKRKLKLQVLSFLDSWADQGYFKACPTESSTTSQESRGGPLGSPSSKRQVLGRGRSTRRLPDEDPDDEDETNDNGGQDGKNTRASSSQPSKIFSCPYYKRDPRRHTTHRSCQFPGYKDLHRLKLVKQTQEWDR